MSLTYCHVIVSYKYTFILQTRYDTHWIIYTQQLNNNNMYRIKYNKETKYYTVSKNNTEQLMSYSYQRCIDYISQFDSITYVYNNW